MENKTQMLSDHIKPLKNNLV